MSENDFFITATLSTPINEAWNFSCSKGAVPRIGSEIPLPQQMAARREMREYRPSVKVVGIQASRPVGAAFGWTLETLPIPLRTES